MAFIDVLGFGALVDRAFSGDDALLQRLYESLNFVATYNSRFGEGPLGSRSLSPHLLVTAFSDSIVVSDRDEDGALESVLSVVAFLGAGLLSSGILCRGAIAAGPTIHEERVIIGTGMIEAYRLEQEAAVYPRVVISDTLVSRVSQSQALTLHRVKRDIDGFWFVDIFFEFSGFLESLGSFVFGATSGHHPP